jgi:hypothetical protein
VPDLDDLIIDQCATLAAAPDPLRTGFLGGAIAGEHVVFDVTFADAPEEGMHVLAQVLGCAALAGLGDLINRRHDLPSRQRGDGEVEVIFETPSERRHCWFPVDDLASGQRRFVGAIFNDQDRQRRALLVGELLPLDLALGLVRIDHLASGDGRGLARGLLIELGPCAQRLALGASRPRLGEQEDPGPPTCRAHPDRKPWLLCVVEIVLRLARRQRGRTDRRVSELQVVLWPEIFTVRFHRLCPYSLCLGTRRGRPKKRITNRSRHVPSSVVPHGKIHEGTAGAYKM